MRIVSIGNPVSFAVPQNILKCEFYGASKKLLAPAPGLVANRLFSSNVDLWLLFL